MSTPILTPFLNLLHSKRFLIAFASLIGGLITLAVPALAPLSGSILTLIVALAVTLIGGYSYEDGAAAGKDAASQPVQDVATLVKDLFGQLVEAEFGGNKAVIASSAAPLQYQDVTHVITPAGDITTLQSGTILALKKSDDGTFNLTPVPQPDKSSLPQ